MFKKNNGSYKFTVPDSIRPTNMTNTITANINDVNLQNVAEHHSNEHDHSHNHGHNHDHGNGKCKLTKTMGLIIMLFLTGSFFIVELIVGHITKSNTLVADAFHMLSDLISLIVGLTAVRISKITASKRNTFGWARAEILGSLVNSVFLLALCFSIIVEAINRFFEPQSLKNIDLMLIVGGTGLFINLIGLVIFGFLGHGHSHDGGGHDHSHGIDNKAFTEITVQDGTHELPPIKVKQSKNMNIQGVFLHVMSDALGSVAVIIGGLIVKYGPPHGDTSVKWKLYVDPTLSVVITIFITISTVTLFKHTSFVLLQGTPKHFDVENFKKLVRNVSGVLDVHHFHVWSLNSDKHIASAHLRVRKQDNYGELDTLYDVKRILHRHNIHATTLQLDYDTDVSEKKFDFCEKTEECQRRQCCNSVEVS